MKKYKKVLGIAVSVVLAGVMMTACGEKEEIPAPTSEPALQATVEPTEAADDVGTVSMEEGTYILNDVGVLNEVDIEWFEESEDEELYTQYKDIKIIVAGNNITLDLGDGTVQTGVYSIDENDVISIDGITLEENVLAYSEGYIYLYPGEETVIRFILE